MQRASYQTFGILLWDPAKERPLYKAGPSPSRPGENFLKLPTCAMQPEQATRTGPIV